MNNITAHVLQRPVMRGMPPMFVISIIYLIGCLDVINIFIDDLYITLRYLHNFINGYGIVFNAGERIEGYSNPTWLFLLAFLAKTFDITGQTALIYLARGTSLLIGFGIILVFFLMVQETGRKSPLLYLFPFIIAINPSLNVYNFSGLETPFITFLLGVVVLLYLKLQRSGKIGYLIAFSVFLGILSISRPEGIIYLVTLLGGMFVIDIITRRAISTNLIISTLISGAIFLGFIAFRWFYYHDILPNTLYAKNSPTMLVFKEGIMYVLGFAALYVAPFVFLAFVNDPSSQSLRWEHLPLYLTVLAQFAFAAYAGGDWMPGYRLMLPVVPLIYFLIFQHLNVQHFSPLRMRFFAIIVVCIAASLIIAGRDKIKEEDSYTTGLKFDFVLYRETYYDMGATLNTLAGPDDLVLIGEAGLIPYISDTAQFTDIYGLINRYVAKDLEGRIHTRTDNDYFLSLDMDYFVAMSTTKDRLVCDQEHNIYETGYDVVDILIQDPRFHQKYIPVYTNQQGILFQRYDAENMNPPPIVPGCQPEYRSGSLAPASGLLPVAQAVGVTP